MLASYLLSLREGIEAALIVGIVLGALRQMRRRELSPAVWLGVISAAAISLATAILLSRFGLALEGTAEPIFEGLTMILAAILLTWMIFWMSKAGRTLKSDLEADVHRAANTAGKRALFFVAFLAVLREGIELALFLTASVFASNAAQTIFGAFLGLGTAILLGWSLFATTVRLDLHRFFQVTGLLLILFAAGLIAHGVHEFNEVGWIPAIIEHVWDVNPILNEKSLGGELLTALFGYNGNPSLTEILAYLAYLITVFFAIRGGQNKVTGTVAETQA
ncbi:MAG: iron uptake transporter permease EfeU [Anaerolineae bacterium]